MQPTPGEYWEAVVVTANDVSIAQSAGIRARADLDAAELLFSEIEDSQIDLSRLIGKYERIQIIRRKLEGSTTRAGGLVLAYVVCGSLPLVVGHALGVHWTIITGVLISVWSLLAYYGIRLFKPDDTELEFELAAWQRDLAALNREEVEANEQIQRATTSYEQARANFEHVLAEFLTRINRLRLTDWRMLQSIPFENFLVEVFLEWGYEVETTKTSGDQGVDLIVTKNGIRTAIQAKGYLSSTVGNEAVQQAYTGMAIYKCHRCAVITNSRFTASAQQAAAKVGCLLINGESIPLLINGHLGI
jgi:hypothetical protein